MQPISWLPILKGISIPVLFGLSYLMGTLPVRWKKFQTNPKLIAICNTFSAGIFISMAFLHLLPESHEIFRKMDPNDSNKPFPFCFFIATISFSFMLVIEKVIFDASHSHEPKSLSQTESGNLSEEKHLEFNDEGGFLDNTDQKKNINEENKPLMEKETKNAHTHNLSLEKTYKNFVSNVQKTSEKIEYSFHQKENPHLASPYFLLLGLAFHCLFEGIALGVLGDTATFLDLMIAIFLHKWIEALSLGINFARSNIKENLSMGLLAIFSASGPLGIAIGWGISNTYLVVSAIFLSISAGIFIYIGGVEIINEEFTVSRHKFLKLLFYLLGVCLIIALWFVEQN